MKTKSQTCEGGGDFRSPVCGRTARYHESTAHWPDGTPRSEAWFCGTHAPSRIKARQEKRDTLHDAERQERRQKMAQEIYTIVCDNMAEGELWESETKAEIAKYLREKGI